METNPTTNPTTTINQYELTVLLDEHTAEQEAREVMRQLLAPSKNPDEATIEDWGVKRLAYPIGNHDRARYMFAKNIKMTEEEAKTYYATVHEDSRVIRSLLVKADPKWVEKGGR